MIIWVYCLDGFGIIKVFVDFMQVFLLDWIFGIGKLVKWLVGVGVKGNFGVVGVIVNCEGVIGYVNQLYIKGNVKVVVVQNKFGEFFQFFVEVGVKVFNGIEFDQYLVGSNFNLEVVGVYFIVIFIWVLVYVNGNGVNVEVVQEVFNYMFDDVIQNWVVVLGFVFFWGSIFEKFCSVVVGIQF